jgi:uncharacterized membrane protein
MKQIYNKAIVNDPASNFRFLARQGMTGKAGMVFTAGLLYLLALNFIPEVLFGSNGIFGPDGSQLQDIVTNYVYSGGGFAEDIFTMLAPLYTSLLFYGILVGGALSLGIAIFGLQLRRFQLTNTGQVFSGFNNYGRALLLTLLETVFTFLWALLFIIPGIIAAYRYRLAVYILADNPEISPLEAIRISKEMMKGNKVKLFCIDLSFIGWAILCSLAASIPVSFIGVIAGVSSDSLYTGATVAYSQPLGTIIVIITSVLTALASGWLIVYESTAVAAFYERATGLIVPQYVDNNNYPQQQNLG